MSEGTNSIESRSPITLDPKNNEIDKSPNKTEHFDVLTKENVDEFMERRLKQFSNRYAELYADKLGLDKDELSESIRQKIKNNYTNVVIEDVITGEDEVKLTEDGKLTHSKKGDPLTAASYQNNRTNSKGEFKFKPYADQDDVLNTKTIYHEFLHALGGTMRPVFSGAEEFSLGVQFDYNSGFINHYKPFEEGFTEIIAAEMAGLEPQSYTYEVPVCVLIRKIIGDKSFLETKNGNLEPLFAEFSYEKLEELRDIFWVYENGTKNRLENIKYINRENRSLEINSTETVVNEYMANESYISSSTNLTSFFVEHFNYKISGIRTQTDANDLFQILVNCKTTEQDILPPGNFYESSISAINQALTDSQITLAKYCRDHNLQIPDEFHEPISTKFNQNREQISINNSVSSLQLYLLDQEITSIDPKSNLSPTDLILLTAKKWIYTSIETQKKYQELYPGFNRRLASVKQLEAIHQIDPEFKRKYEFSKETYISSVPNWTFITNKNISFTKGGYHGSVPDYGFLIAKSLNIEFLKSIFGDYATPTLNLGIQGGVLKDVDFEKAKGYLKEIKGTVKDDELSVIGNSKELSQKQDGLSLDSDTLNSIAQLGDLKINDFIQLRI